MTISSTDRKAGPYTGNASTTAFPFSFKVFSSADVLVIGTDLSGAETTKVLGSDYSIALNPDQNATPGGTVNMSVAPASGFLVTVTSDIGNLQPTQLTNAGGFYPKVINDSLDRLTILAQQNAEQIGRSVKVPISSSVTPDSLIAKLAADAATAAAAAGSASASETAAAASAAAAALIPGPSGSANVGHLPAGTGVVATNVESVLNGLSVNPVLFGADPSGAADSTAAFDFAVAYLRVLGGGSIDIPEGTFLLNGVAGTDGILNGILLPFNSPNGTENRINIRGRGKSTILQAGSNSMIVVRMSDSHSGIENLTISGAGKTGVIGQALVPEDWTQSTTLVWQQFNYCRDVYIADCADGLMLRSGPKVGGFDSGCWYNSFENYHILNCTRGIWLRSATQALGSPTSRCKFKNIRIGGSASGNTGVQIDAGSTHTFWGLDCEGIATGASPNATPTALKIAATDSVSSLDNNSNVFFGSMFEANTRDLNNANAFTEFYGYCMTGSKMLLTATPKVMIGGDASSAPQVIPGLKYQNGFYVSGVDLNTLWLDGGLANGPTHHANDQGFSWTSYAISTINATNTTSIVDHSSKYQRLGGFVDWSARIKFQATSASTAVVVTLPRTPSSHYTSFSNIQPMLVPVVVLGASGQMAVTYARFDAADPTKLTVYPPSFNWHTGAFSEIHLNVRYMETGF